jgi:transposase
MNQIRGFLLDRGLAVRKGPSHLRQLLPLVLDESSSLFCGRLCCLLKELQQEWKELERRLEEVSHEIETIAKHNEVSLRLMEIPGFGPWFRLP